ncbi:hypothetical protein ACJEHT_13570 [Legionella pneumophila]|uniref:hypothetical protein n=1 Tax=Legionella pneumophila TaxID=446 RepID=UPI000315E07D
MQYVAIHVGGKTQQDFRKSLLSLLDMSPFEDRESKLNPLPANFPKWDNLEEEGG